MDSQGKEIHSYDYTYNLAGNITKIEKGNTSADEDKASVASGEAEEEEDITVTMEYSDDNRLLSYNGEEVQYDEEGNMTYGPLDGKMTEFVYDCRNRLIKAGDTEYSYDAENNRIAVTKDGVTTKYVVDSNCEYSQVLTATTDDSVITYIYGDGLIAQESDNSNLIGTAKTPSSNDTVSLTGYVTYHYNQVGSTTALTDAEGSVIETYEYSPYGDILDGDIGLSMFLYNGKYGVASDGNGLYYMRARYYDISIKRFVNQDVVIGHLDATSSLNRYAYCEGNPVSYLDPFGLDRSDFQDWHDNLSSASYILTAIGIVFPVTEPVVIVINIAVNCFDIGMYLGEMFMSGFDKDVTFNCLKNMFFDLIFTVSAPLKTAKIIKEELDTCVSLESMAKYVLQRLNEEEN